MSDQLVEIAERYASGPIMLGHDVEIRVAAYEFPAGTRGPLGQLAFYAGAATFGIAGITPDALTELRDACDAALAAMQPVGAV